MVRMKGAPRSAQFDDVYFSAENGLAETHHVFLQGNNLPAAWQGAERYTIAETGFGTGLNFLALWKLFDDTAGKNAQLDFISFEKFPLTAAQIREGLEPFASELQPYLDQYLARYPILVPGYHRLDFGRVRLTLIFDDVNVALPLIDAAVDCWFLDGFTPSKNPEMWTDAVFQNMMRVTRSGGTFATFTAAGFVKRGLREAGFRVEKADGFGSKRDMLTGKKDGVFIPQKKVGGSVAIVGGGLAGTAAARVLSKRGLLPTIYEAGNALADGASGSMLGMFNPRFCAQRNADSDFYTAAYAQFLRSAHDLRETDFKKVGALHLVNTPEKEKRFYAMLENWGWDAAHMRCLNAQEASDIAEIKISAEALYLPDGGYVAPYKLCEAYAKECDIRYNSFINNMEEIDADYIVLAGGAAMKKLVPWLPVHGVRGQVTSVESKGLLSSLKCNVHYGGYISAACDGVHKIGATFQKWLEHIDVLEEDHAENIARLKENIPAFTEESFSIQSGWSGIRTSSHDRFPIIGKVPGHENLYVSTAHASHGIVSSLAGAHLLADMICGTPFSQTPQTIEALAPKRFIDRAERKGQVLEGYTNS